MQLRFLVSVLTPEVLNMDPGLEVINNSIATEYEIQTDDYKNLNAEIKDFSGFSSRILYLSC